MNSKLLFFILSLLISANTLFPVAPAANCSAAGTQKPQRSFYQPNWFGTSLYNREREIFNSLPLAQQKLLYVLLGKLVGSKMSYPNSKQQYEAVIAYLDEVGDQAINTSIRLGIGTPLNYAKTHKNEKLETELERRLSILKKQKTDLKTDK